MHHERERAFCDRFKIPFPYVPPESMFHPNPNPRKILCISDPHEPYSAEYVFDDAMAFHHDASMLVIPGDCGDYYSKSRFKKTHPGDFPKEVFAVFKRLEWASQRFRSVKVMLGNHDNRPEKKISTLLELDVELKILTEQNLLLHLACYFPNVELVGHTVKGEGIGLTYIWQYGDMTFLHAEISRAQSSATMEWLSGWLHEWGHLLKLQPYRVIFQGHNHQSMKKDVDGETWLQIPTASDPYSLGMEYIYTRMYKHPPVVGYTVIHHDEGVCSTNETHNVVIRST
jgi:predicted phosphodiesterase